jgi:hypothetical protein
MLRFGHEINGFFDRKKREQYETFREGKCLIYQVKDRQLLVYFYYQTSLFKYDTLSDEINIIDENPIPVFINGYVSEFDITTFLEEQHKFIADNVIFYYIQHDIIFYRILDYDDINDMQRDKFISFLKEIINIHINNIKVNFFHFDKDDMQVIERKIKIEEDSEYWYQMPSPIEEQVFETPSSIMDL